jgi:drug/metabolite transporter (DMT)-like permease
MMPLSAKGREHLGNLLLLLAAALGFGSAFALTHVAVADIPPMSVAALRALVATLAVGGYLWLSGIPLPTGRSDLGVYFMLGVLSTAVPFAAIALGQARIASSLGGILFATIPLFTLLLGWLSSVGGRPRLIQIAGALIGLAGVGLAVGGPAETSQTVGIAVTLIAPVAYASGGIVAQRFDRFDPRALAFGQLAAGSLLLAPALLGRVTSTSLYIGNAGLLIVLGIACTALPMVAVFTLIRRTGAAGASIVTLLFPVVAVSIGVLFLGEPLKWSLLTGFALVLSGAYLIVRQASTGRGGHSGA